MGSKAVTLEPRVWTLDGPLRAKLCLSFRPYKQVFVERFYRRRSNDHKEEARIVKDKLRTHLKWAAEHEYKEKIQHANRVHCLTRSISIQDVIHAYSTYCSNR